MPLVDPGEFDPFAPGTNLKEDFVGTITAAQFIKADNAQNYSLQVTILAEDGDEVEVRYGCGGDWASYDGGESVEHPHGVKTKFNGQTAYSQFIRSMATSAPAGSEGEKYLRERNRELDGRGPQFASMWLGITEHWDVKDVPFRTRVEKDGVVTWEPSTTQRVLPDRWVGVANQESLPLSGGGEVPALGDLFDTLSISDQTKIKVLAKSSTHDAFVDAICSFTTDSGSAILENSELLTFLTEQSFYESLKG